MPREELPEEYQPHASFYNKIVNIAAGVDPTRPEDREERRRGQIADIEGQGMVDSLSESQRDNSLPQHKIAAIEKSINNNNNEE